MASPATKCALLSSVQTVRQNMDNAPEQEQWSWCIYGAWRSNAGWNFIRNLMKIRLSNYYILAVCSGLMYPDTDFGEITHHDEVFDEHAKSYIFYWVLTQGYSHMAAGRSVALGGLSGVSWTGCTSFGNSPWGERSVAGVVVSFGLENPVWLSEIRSTPLVLCINIKATKTFCLIVWNPRWSNMQRSAN